MQDIKDKLIDFLVANITKLKFEKYEYKYSKYYIDPTNRSHYKMILKKASFSEMNNVLMGTSYPFEWRDVYSFIDGYSNQLQLNNGYDIILITKYA